MSGKQAEARKQKERKKLVGNLTTMVQEMRKVCIHPQLSKYWNSLSEGLSLQVRICYARGRSTCCTVIAVDAQAVNCMLHWVCHQCFLIGDGHVRQGRALGMDQILGRMAEEKQQKLQVCGNRNQAYSKTVHGSSLSNSE